MYYRDVATIDGGYLGPSTVLKSVQGVRSSNFRDTHLGGGPEVPLTDFFLTVYL